MTRSANTATIRTLGIGLLLAAALMGCPQEEAETAWAEVLLIRGDVTADKEPVVEGQRLRRASTRLKVGPGASVVLGLHNHHVVRLEDDVSLALGDLLAFSLPPLAEAQRAQARRLVLEGAITPVTDADRERVAGWHARVTAGRVAPTEAYGADKAEAVPAAKDRAAPAQPLRSEGEAQGAKEKGHAKAKKAKKRSPAKPSGTQSKAAVPRQQGARAGSPAPKTDAAPALELREDAAQGLGSGPGVRPTKNATAPMEANAAPGGESSLQRALQGTALATCLRKHLNALGVAAESATVRVRVRDGKVFRVQLLQGLPTPRCATSLLQGRTASPDGKSTHTVSLTPPKAAP